MAHSKDSPDAILSAVVVNDNTTQLNGLIRLLQKAGLTPIPFANAEKALAAMDIDAPPALIVTGLYMPGIDGWRFCRLLRSPEYARFNQVPVLVVSSTLSGEEPSRITSDLGANAFLPVPVDEQLFINQVQALLKGEKPQTELKVLVVEPDRQLSARLETVFQAHGYLTDAAFTYQQGLTRIGQSPFDAAVLDCDLPDGFGDALLKILQEKTPGCVCMMLTSDPRADLALAWMKMGAAAYLHKPFDPEYLIAQCEQARRERALLRVEELLELRAQPLRENQEQYLSLINDSSDSIFAFNPDGTYRFVNKAFARPFGKRPEEIIGKTPHAVFSPEEAEKRLALIRQVFRTGQKGEIEGVVIKQTGEELFYLTHADPIKDEDGKVLYITCTSKDITERKRIEEALHDHERMLSTLISNLPGFIYRCANDPDWSMVYISDGCQEITGYSPEDFLHNAKLPFKNIIDPEYREMLWQKWQVLLKQRNPFEEEYPIITARGDTRWVWERGRGVFSDQGELLYLEGFITDITERKQVEKMLVESEEKFMKVFRDAPVWIAITNMKSGIYLDVNEQALRASGFAREEVIGHTAAEIGWISSSDRARLVQEIQDHGRIAGLEMVFHAKNGSLLYGWVGGEQVIIGGRPCLLTVTVDVTERMQVEQALRESEEKYRLIVENQHGLVLKTDAEQRFLYANPAYCDLFGITEADLLGSTFKPLVHPDDMVVVNNAMEVIFQPPYEAAFEERVDTPHGWRWLSWVAKATRDEQGVVTAIIGSGRDITERKQAEAKINEQLEELRRWYNATLGREERILQLKSEVNRLLIEGGKPPRYTSVLDVKVE
jgi:PAS domain S-box-containing protein